jgi:hypothetical protein
MAAQGRAGGDPDPRLPWGQRGKAMPYGVYDLTANAGWVSGGTDHVTAVFAVESPLVEGGRALAWTIACWPR